MKPFKLTVVALLFSAFGQVAADYEDGLAAAQRGDYETALQEFKDAAEDGLMMAQYNLAILYFSGRGTEQNFAEAFRWTAAAADQGHTQAQFNLGALYYEGQGTGKNRQTALEWYEKAGSADYAPAQYNAAEMYFRGDGIERNLVRAHAWASRALENDHEEAPALLENIEADMSAAQLSEARRLFARMKIGMDY
ncbi:MAG: sel1 repeat family protein [Pseudomonadales bacterium]|nr:sel1 repeat family protein [Pseudomonadales bacterium]MCP5346535.1 sel1 repeat family protein [Pseudomonadales bacterium]